MRVVAKPRSAPYTVDDYITDRRNDLAEGLIKLGRFESYARDLPRQPKTVKAWVALFDKWAKRERLS